MTFKKVTFIFTEHVSLFLGKNIKVNDSLLITGMGLFSVLRFVYTLIKVVTP